MDEIGNCRYEWQNCVVSTRDAFSKINTKFVVIIMVC